MRGLLIFLLGLSVGSGVPCVVAGLFKAFEAYDTETWFVQSREYKVGDPYP